MKTSRPPHENPPLPESTTPLDAPTESPASVDSASSAHLDPDASLIQEVAKSSDLAARRGIRHYLYLPTKKVARQIAATLQQRDFDVEVDRAAIGKNWLVRASHRVVLSGEYIADMRQFLEDLVEPLHGEYDGWEAEVCPQTPASDSD